MQIKTYEVIINEKNAKFGVVVNLEAYDIRFLATEYLKYEVNHSEKTLRVFSPNASLSFGNLNDESLYYATKSTIISILGGIPGEPPKITLVLEAEIN